MALGTKRRRWLLGAGLVGGALVVLALVVAARVRHEVREAVAEPVRDVRPLALLETRAPAATLPRWSGPELTGVRLTPDGGWLAGAFGIVGLADAGGGRLAPRPEIGLPSLSVSALTEWRGRAVVALRAGGVFVRDGGTWRELRSGWGALEVRVLDESAGGELMIGARQGLFRVLFGAREIERLSSHAVRALALGDGYVVAGGEDGLERWAPRELTPIEAADRWIESLALLPAAGGEGRIEVWAVTATGVVRGPSAGPLAAVAGGERVTSAVRFRDQLVGVEEGDAGGTSGGESRLRWFGADGRSRSERLERAPTRLFADGDVLVADTAEGAWWLTPGAAWRPAPWSLGATLPPGSAHVTALALAGDRVVAGVFDGGLIERRMAAPAASDAEPWRVIPGARAWGVNALLASGGATYVASLRGAARLVGDELTAIEGPGAAFSLAATDDGVAIGYGQGVLLPGGRLLSAFHGLPGNQALALATADSTLFVGTPSGLGALRDRKVRWRMATGDEKLPNPWITALLVHQGQLYVGTYGGGVARRAVADLANATNSASVPPLERFVESEGWKVNPGGLAAWNGRCYVATDGDGLFRSSRDGSRFEPVAAALPSVRVTALTPTPQALYIGTDQGIAVLTPELE